MDQDTTQSDRQHQVQREHAAAWSHHGCCEYEVTAVHCGGRKWTRAARGLGVLRRSTALGRGRLVAAGGRAGAREVGRAGASAREVGGAGAREVGRPGAIAAGLQTTVGMLWAVAGGTSEGVAGRTGLGLGLGLGLLGPGPGQGLRLRLGLWPELWPGLQLDLGPLV